MGFFFSTCECCARSIQNSRFHYYNAGRTDHCQDCVPHWFPLVEPDLSLLKDYAALPDEPDDDHGDAFAPFLDHDLRRRHVYVIGRTGSGKTNFLTFLAAQDAARGDGLAFLDPHGDAAEELLGHIPETRLDDVIYFAPTSPACPPFNLLALPYAPHKLAADIVSLFRLFFDSWGPQLEQILLNGLTALLADRPHEPHTLADLERLLLEPDYRAAIAARLPDDKLRDFWRERYDALPKGAAQPVLNKLNAFMPPLSPLARIFAQPANALDFPAILNGRKIFVANLSKGELGDEPARLLGGLLTTAIQQAALARATLAEEERRDFFFYADEFQTYVVDSFDTILTEARKYRLCLTLANQQLAQLSPKLRASVFGAGTLVAFATTATDASALKSEMRATRYLEGVSNKLVDPAQKARAFRATVRAKARAVLDQAKPCPFRDPPTPDLMLTERQFTDVKEWIRYYHENRAACDRGVNNYDKPTEWPRAEDFSNLPTGHALARLRTASDVRAFIVPRMVSTTAARHRAAILARQRAAFTPPPPPAPSKPKLPETEDDRLC